MINKILVAVAGRGLCEEMLNMLMDLPSLQQASITLLHVVPSQVTAEGMSAKLEEGGKILAQAVQSVKVDPQRVNPRLKQGDPKDIVCQVADEENADLIIIGSRGLGRLQAILENSVSQYVFQLTSRPMLLVKDDTYIKKLRRVMVAYNSSPEAQECLKTAIDFVKDIQGGQLIIAHVNKDLSGQSAEDYTANAENDPVLAPAVAQAKQMGLSYRCVTGTGKPGPEICRIAEDINADLLLLGSPDRRPTVAKSFIDIDRLLGNSLSDYVRVYANCPVLLTRHGG
ncbi:MAG: universal stress protein [Limnospira sp. PMC 1291.21]|uniref:UspA domain protein n=2 Tax=Limnospira TaxID=2596745 RepID=B5W272_LIMMA|nr:MULTISPECIES: universal stress protein [Limnospira]EKD11598.1 UspA domain protein [Arthrospira platensis C1]MDC0836721.1 universal stress protein [Limnoraphis robusta]MDY7054680.1 universal stress protein [Limnospira fusiformis LS22]QJB27397.1 universal stress protein [Limnospira fusiformis SAG 85.79]EDZ94319.1 UspA domain protein [Limnospira maxima CS-328]